MMGELRPSDTLDRFGSHSMLSRVLESTRRSLVFAGAALLLATRAHAQDSVAKLPPIVTVTRDIGRSALDLPYAISETRPDSARPGQTHLLVD